MNIAYISKKCADLLQQGINVTTITTVHKAFNDDVKIVMNQEPLSDDEIMNLAIKSASDQTGEEFNKDELSKDDWKHLIYFARYIEKAHGIGE